MLFWSIFDGQMTDTWKGKFDGFYMAKIGYKSL